MEQGSNRTTDAPLQVDRNKGTTKIAIIQFGYSVRNLNPAHGGADNGVHLSFARGNLGSKTTFPRMREILGGSDTRVGKVAIRKSRGWSWTPNTELLERNLGLRQRRCLLRKVGGRPPSVKGRCNFRITPLHFLHQFLKRAGKNRNVSALG